MTKKQPKEPWRSALESYPEHVRAIGMISIENGNLEHSMVKLLSKAAGVSLRVADAIFFTARAASVRIEIFENAARAALAPKTKTEYPEHKTKREAARKKALKIAERAKKLTFKRHSVIHDTWGATDEGDVVRFVTEPFSSKQVDVTLSDLHNLVRDFRQLIDDIEALTDEFAADPPFLVKL